VLRRTSWPLKIMALATFLALSLAIHALVILGGRGSPTVESSSKQHTSSGEGSGE